MLSRMQSCTFSSFMLHQAVTSCHGGQSAACVVAMLAHNLKLLHREYFALHACQFRVAQRWGVSAGWLQRRMQWTWQPQISSTTTLRMAAARSTGSMQYSHP